MRSTLLVASAGGHLAELASLVDRIQPPIVDRTWVTYDRPDATALLVGEDVVAGYGPTTRHLGNAARNALLAWKLLRSRPFGRVISTGAGIAVPFLGTARLLGIPAHYIELSTRLTGPSLSGRILQWIPGVHLYEQSARWGGVRWSYAGSVYDGFESRPQERPDRPLRFLVALGSHTFPFDALVQRVSELVHPEEEVNWQLGATSAQGLPGETHGLVSPQALEKMSSRADVVICHAGVGLAQTALSLGRCPVLVPRRAERDEHVDNHQVELARHLSELGLAVHAEAGELDREDLERAARVRVTRRTPRPFRLQR